MGGCTPNLRSFVHLPYDLDFLMVFLLVGFLFLFLNI